MLPQGEGWVLPEFLPDREHPELPQAQQAVRAQFGIDAGILYSLRHYEAVIPGPLNLFVLERADADWHPPAGGRWIGTDEMPGLQALFPQQQRVLMAWLAETAGTPAPSLDLPWWEPGWLTDVEGWLLPQVQHLGYTPAGPVERLRSAYTSAIVKVPALPADLYLKMMAPPLAHEAALLPILASQAPARFPSVLMNNTAEGWILMRDMGGRPLDSDVAIERWEEVARAYGEVQLAAAPRIGDWLALGCRDLRLPRLEEEIEHLFAHVPERLRGLNEQLSKPLVIDVAALQARSAAFKELATQVAGSGLPPSLEHGDFHAGNVQVTEDGCIFYDWSHATLAYPLSDFGDLFYDDDWFPGRPDFADRMRDAYLQPWTAYLPLPELQAAFRQAQPLRKLYAAVQQGRLIAAYQQLLGGQDYVPETPSGNALTHMQWWFADELQALVRMEFTC
jgi:hypothetical protein